MSKKTTIIKPGYKKKLPDIMKRATDLLPPKKHEAGTLPVLVIDGMNIAYQAYFAYKRLTYKRKSVAILFGFPSILKSIIQIYPCQKVIVCWDGVKHTKRLELCPGYKSHRLGNMDPREKEDMLKQIEKTRQLLYRLGISQAHNPAVEGDDMIYKVVKRQQVLSKVIIVSADSDFKQLINWDVSVYNPRKKFIETVFAYTAGNYGLEIPQYIDFKSLVGDHSDDIPGLRGIGEVRAAAFLSRFWSIENYLKSDEDFSGMVDKEKVKEVYKTNRTLINLEYFDRKHNKQNKILYYRNKIQPKYNELKVLRICGKYNFKAISNPIFLKHFKKLNDE